MKLKLLSVKFPKKYDDWGIAQVNNFSNTYFRFEMKKGKPVLDTSFFADNLENLEDKHKDLSPDSDLYKGVQKLLTDYVEETGVIKDYEGNL